MSTFHNGRGKAFILNYTDPNDPEHVKLEIAAACSKCFLWQTFIIEESGMYRFLEIMDEWSLDRANRNSNGTLIQDLPLNLNEDVREFVLWGLCPMCADRVYNNIPAGHTSMRGCEGMEE